MLLMTAVVYSLAILMAPHKGTEESSPCQECTYVIKDTSASEYRLQGGETICIRKKGRFTGRILRWQGDETCRICNEGSFHPSQLSLESGINILDNYGEVALRKVTAHTPSLSVQLTNYANAVLSVEQLILNGPSHNLTNGGILSIGEFFLSNAASFRNESTGQVEVRFQTHSEGKWQNEGNLVLGHKVLIGPQAEIHNVGKVWCQDQWVQEGGKFVNEGYFSSTDRVRLRKGSKWILPGESLLNGGLDIQAGSILEVNKLLIQDTLTTSNAATWEINSQLLFTGKEIEGQLSLNSNQAENSPSFWYVEPSACLKVQEIGETKLSFIGARRREIIKQVFPVNMTILPHLRKLEAQIQFPSQVKEGQRVRISRYNEEPAFPDGYVYMDEHMGQGQVFHWMNDSLIEGIQNFQVEISQEGLPPILSEPRAVLHIKNQATATWEFLEAHEKLEIKWFSAMEVQGKWVLYNKQYEFLKDYDASLHKGNNEISLEVESDKDLAYYLRLEVRDAHLFYPFIPIQ